MKVVGIIPSRYASTRFPGKPLAMIKGKTMIHRVCEQAWKSKLDAVVVATDDMRIAEEVLSFGGQYVLTDPMHRSGTDRCCEALDILETQYDAVVNIQGDEPFIDPKEINLLVDLISRDDTQLASLVKRFDDEEELFGPNKVKVVMDKDGKALYFSRSPIPFLRNVDKDKWFSTNILAFMPTRQRLCDRLLECSLPRWRWLSRWSSCAGSRMDFPSTWLWLKLITSLSIALTIWPKLSNSHKIYLLVNDDFHC